MSRSLKIGVICIGDELLRGFTVNTNMSDIGSELLQHGFDIAAAAVIPDKRDIISETVKDMLKDMDVIISTGGLGPTVDDITRDTVARLLNLKLKTNNDVAEYIKNYWSGKTEEMPESVMRQAMIPEGADFFPNKVGTAPGLLINAGNSDLPAIILLPGPPSEMLPMLRNHAIPYIISLKGFANTFTEILSVSGIPESNVEALTLPFVKDSDVSIAYCASPGCVKIYISGSDKKDLALLKKKLRKILGTHALPEGISSPVEALADLCIRKKITLAIAESCTGGMIAASLTDLPGVSAIFKGGAVVYSNDIKIKVLGVNPATIEQHGAVSAECADEMVKNICILFDADAGISVTGIAGPESDMTDKPVGLVYIGAAFEKKKIVRKFNFSGNRDRIRRRTMHTACSMLIKLLSEHN